jgi:hypothetical protein
LLTFSRVGGCLSTTEQNRFKRENLETEFELDSAYSLGLLMLILGYTFFI